MIRPDFRDYQGRGVELIHSAKGSTWKDHKYIYKEEADAKREARKNGQSQPAEKKKSPQEILSDLKKSGKYTAEEIARFGKMTAEELNKIGASVSTGAKKVSAGAKAATSAAKSGIYKLADEATAERTSRVRPTHPMTNVKKRGASPASGSKVSGSRIVSRGTNRDQKSSNMTERVGGKMVTRKTSKPTTSKTVTDDARKKKKTKRTLRY